MEPLLIAYCISASLLGCGLGLFSGMVPGIHVNTLATVMLASSAALEDLFPGGAIAMCCCIVSASVVHSYVDFVPSAFIGAPDAEDAVSVLPAHRLLLEGKGMTAVRAAAIGSMIGCSAAILLAIPLQWIMLNGGDEVLDKLTPVVLLIAAGVVLSNEFFKGNGWWGALLFLTSGVLGLACMVLVIPENGILGEGSVMMPLLCGLFGIPVMLETSDRVRIPPQTDWNKRPVNCMPGLRGVFMGTVAGWFPGITATVGASMSSVVFPEKNPAGFISTVSSIGTVTAILSLVTLSVSGNGRSGTALAVGQILNGAQEGFMSGPFLLLLLAAALASPIGYLLTIGCGKFMSKTVSGLNPKKLGRTVVVFLVILSLALNGPAGVIILGTSTAVGMLPGICGTGRTVLCGCLLFPVILFEFGLFRSKPGRCFFHELRVLHHESFVNTGTDFACSVPHRHGKDQSSAVNLREHRFADNLRPYRRGRGVNDVQTGTHGTEPFVEVRMDALAGGGLD